MSAQLPRLEARVTAVERMQAILHARIEELSADTISGYVQLKDHQIQTERRLDARIEELLHDMTASFKQLAEYQIQAEQKIDERFDKIEEDVAVIKGDVATVKENMVAMEAKMATKEGMAVLEGRLKGDMSSMETRILDAFKQLLTVIDSRLPLQA